MSPDETARLAVETYHEHCGRCPVCRKSCGCTHCKGVVARKCERGKVLMDVAAETASIAMRETSHATW